MSLDIASVVLIIIFAVVYGWILYNIPILGAGVRNLRAFNRKKNDIVEPSIGDLPSFSIIIPVKNEAAVINRLLNSLTKLDYPVNKYETVVVEDGSRDDSLKISLQFASSHDNVRVLQKDVSSGKPSALNFGLKHSRGEIIVVLDADSVPAPDMLSKAAGYFEDSKVAAVQGKTMSINSKQNMLTQMISYEDAVWNEIYLRGKDALGLFVHLRGSCQFIRKSILNELSGFDENVLSEDMEFSARLAENNYAIRYAGDVCSWQESTSDLKSLFGQRTRWFRGIIDVSTKYGRLMAKPSKRNFDAEVTLFAPFILIFSLFTYLAGFGTVVFSLQFDFLSIFNYFSLFATTATLILCGIVLICYSKPKSVKSLLWLPFLYGYWCLQAFIALYAGLLTLFRRPKHWLKTEKKGAIADPAFEVASLDHPFEEAPLNA